MDHRTERLWRAWIADRGDAEAALAFCEAHLHARGLPDPGEVTWAEIDLRAFCTERGFDCSMRKRIESAVTVAARCYMDDRLEEVGSVKRLTIAELGRLTLCHVGILDGVGTKTIQAINDLFDLHGITLDQGDPETAYGDLDRGELQPLQKERLYRELERMRDLNDRLGERCVKLRTENARLRKWLDLKKKRSAVRST